MIQVQSADLQGVQSFGKSFGKPLVGPGGITFSVTLLEEPWRTGRRPEVAHEDGLGGMRRDRAGSPGPQGEVEGPSARGRPIALTGREPCCAAPEAGHLRVGKDSR